MSLNSRILELKDKRDYYQMELEDLHMSEPSENWYKQRRYELESQIAMIEDALFDLENEQRMMRPFFWTTVAFVVIVCGLMVYYCAKSNM